MVQIFLYAERHMQEDSVNLFDQTLPVSNSFQESSS